MRFESSSLKSSPKIGEKIGTVSTKLELNEKSEIKSQPQITRRIENSKPKPKPKPKPRRSFDKAVVQPKNFTPKTQFDETFINPSNPNLPISHDSFDFKFINPPNPLYSNPLVSKDSHPREILTSSPIKRQLSSPKTSSPPKKAKLVFGVKKISPLVKRNILEETEKTGLKTKSESYLSKPSVTREVRLGSALKDVSQPRASTYKEVLLLNTLSEPHPDNVWPSIQEPFHKYTTIPEKFPQYHTSPISPDIPSSLVKTEEVSHVSSSPQSSNSSACAEFTYSGDPSYPYTSSEKTPSVENQDRSSIDLSQFLSSSLYPLQPGENPHFSESELDLIDNTEHRSNSNLSQYSDYSTPTVSPQPPYKEMYSTTLSDHEQYVNCRNLSNLTAIPSNTQPYMISLPKPLPAKKCLNCLFDLIDDVPKIKNPDFCPDCPVLGVTLLEDQTLLANQPVSCTLRVQGIQRQGFIKLFTKAGIISYPSCVKSFPPAKHKHPVVKEVETSVFIMQLVNHRFETAFLRPGTTVAAAQLIFLRK